MKGRQTADSTTLRGGAATLQASDAELLERFVAERDESAFAALVSRHGPMVLGVCGRLLRHAQDAEDAFQATFLILIRKAGDIGRRELLGNWLYGVATRVAARARLLATRRQTRETGDIERVAVATSDSEGALDLSTAVTEEVRGLPAKYRLPVVLCHLEGRSNEEAADELGCPVGTVKTRLFRAREMLRRRLIRRGLALSTAAFSTALSVEALTASLPPALVHSTLKTARYFAEGNVAAASIVSAQAIALTKGVLHTMFMTKIKTLAAMVLALVMIAGGTGASAYHLLATKADAKKTDKENIQGTWKFVSIKANGAEDDEQTQKYKEVELVITADTWTMTNYGKQRKEKKATYQIDPAVKPKTLDFTFVLQNGREETLPCIYKLEDGTLTICSRLESRTERPKDFTCEAGSDTVLQIWKRVMK